ncbi:MAG: NINE protein [Chloroflexota bacterium]
MAQETGGPPGPQMVYCRSCGQQVDEQSAFCTHCGARLDAPGRPADTTQYSHRSRIAAGILGIVLGGLGVHRFYLGNIGIGIIQIVVTFITLGIGALWGFVEGIIIIAGANWKDADGRPLRPYDRATP